MTAEKSKVMPRSAAAVPTAGGLAARLAVAELKRREVDPGLLLARCGLSVATLDRRDRIKVMSQIEFLELASKAVRDEYLGLSLAERVDLRELGMLYYVAASSQRLGDALVAEEFSIGDYRDSTVERRLDVTPAAHRRAERIRQRDFVLPRPQLLLRLGVALHDGGDR